MGLLDEAIKDHLELKRRHGADPSEVARQEHEALGPARREPVAEASVAEEPIEAVEEDEVAPVAEQPVTAPEPPLAIYDDDAEDEVIADERLEAPARRAVREPEPEAPAEVDQPTAQFSLEELERAAEEEEAVGEPEPEPAEPEPAEPEPAEPEPAEPEPTQDPHADVVPADEEPDSEDVLEETPEFLQETPEHDRLWFEQKPPRDFDF
jgi:hypothetical protein